MLLFYVDFDIMWILINDASLLTAILIWKWIHFLFWSGCSSQSGSYRVRVNHDRHSKKCVTVWGKVNNSIYHSYQLMLLTQPEFSYWPPPSARQTPPTVSASVRTLWQHCRWEREKEINWDRRKKGRETRRQRGERQTKVKVRSWAHTQATENMEMRILSLTKNIIVLLRALSYY